MTAPADDVGGSQALIASLRAERDAALAVQAALAEVMQAISRSSFDLDHILESIIESATRLCRAKQGSISRRDGAAYRCVAGYGLEPAYREIEMGNVIRPGLETVVGRVAMSCKTVQIADAWNDADYLPRDEARIGQARTMLGVPLLRGGIPVAVIAMARTEVEPFSEREIALVTTFADQAVIAMENARLLTESRDRTRDLQESLEYQTATSDVLQVISRSTFDLQLVLDTLIETAARLCGATTGGIATRQGDAYRIVATFAFSQEWSRRVRQIAFQPGHTSVIGRTAMSRQAVQVADLTTDAEYGFPEVIAIGKDRTALGVPLLREGEPIGVIYLARQHVEPFSERQIDLVRTFADQAIIAIENTRLLGDLRQRTADLQESLEQQTATAEVLQVINSSPGNLAPVFEAMLERAMRLCEADFGFMMSYDGERFRPAAQRGVPPALAAYFAAGPDRPGPGEAHTRVLAGEDLIHSLDYKDEEPYRRGNPLRRAAVNLGGARSALVVALRKDGALLGTFTIYRQEVRPFSNKQIALLQSFAAQAVIAMECPSSNDLRQKVW